jgi:hypothetical protein
VLCLTINKRVSVIEAAVTIKSRFQFGRMKTLILHVNEFVRKYKMDLTPF